MVNLQVSTVIFVGNEDSSYKELIFGEPDSIYNYSSNFYLVDGEKIQTLEPENLDYFFACNAMVPQASSVREVINSQSFTQRIDEDNGQLFADKLPSKEPETSSLTSPKESSGQEVVHVQSSNLQQNTSAHEELDVTSKDVISEPIVHSLMPKEANNDQSSMEDSDTSYNVLKLMCNVSEEKQSLQLIHAIQCNDLNILPILPLIFHCIIDFGVGYTMTESAEILEAVQHLSKKWLIIKTEENSVELSKAFSSHKTPFKTDISLQPEISTKDLALLSHKTEEKAIPYAWYFLCHSIRNAFKEIKRKVMSMDEVSEIAEKCHVSVDKLPNVLTYLHKTGLLLYYKDILPKVVFEDTSIIIEILISAMLNPYNKVAINHDIDVLVHESSFSQTDNVFVEDLFTSQDVIKLLQNLAIVFKIDTQLFCMPTLLTTVFDFGKQGDISPLHVLYPTAPGLFGFLLCYLTSEQNEEPWPWKVRTDRGKREPTCLFKNCAEFTLPGYECTITLLQSSDSLKVYIKFVDGQLPLAKIGKSIIEGVKKANISYHYPDVDIELGFDCHCGSADVVEHTMVYHKQDQHLKCAYNSNRVFPLSYNHKVWFEEGMILWYLESCIHIIVRHCFGGVCGIYRNPKVLL